MYLRVCVAQANSLQDCLRQLYPPNESVDQRVSYCIQSWCQGFGLNATGIRKSLGPGISATLEFDRAFA